MKYVLISVVLVISGAVFPRSNPSKLIESYTVNPIPAYHSPSPLDVPGHLNVYSVNDKGYPTFGVFAYSITAYDQGGVEIDEPVFSVNVKKTSWGDEPELAARCTEQGMMFYTDKTKAGKFGDAICTIGLILWSDLYDPDLSKRVSSWIYADVTIPGFNSDPIAVMAYFCKNENIGYKFFDSPKGSAWMSRFVVQSGMSSANTNTTSNYQSGVSSVDNISWPQDMHNIYLTELDANTIQSLKSYTASFDSVGTKPIFLIGYDGNDTPHYVAMKSHDGVTDRFMPVNSKALEQKYVDANGIAYYSVYSEHGYDLELIRLNGFLSDWLKTDSKYDFNSDGIVDWKDYAIAF